jgi:transposase
MPAKYKITLTDDERQALTALISKGKAAARKRTHAQVLLKADAAPAGPGWSDEQIQTAFSVGRTTIYRVRQAFVEEGLDAALERKLPTGRQFRKLDGAQEARLVALACSAPPEGRQRWTLQLLADKMVVLNIVDAIGRECVRTTLQKTNSSPG